MTDTARATGTPEPWAGIKRANGNIDIVCAGDIEMSVAMDVPEEDAPLLIAAPALRDALTLIHEAARDNWNDWVKDGYETTEPIEFAERTREIARAALKQAEGDET